MGVIVASNTHEDVQSMDNTFGVFTNRRQNKRLLIFRCQKMLQTSNTEERRHYTKLVCGDYNT